MEHLPKWEQLYSMHIGEIIENLNGVDVRRVPGGWLFADSVPMPSKFKGGGDYRHILPPVFVPYKDERRASKVETPPARPQPRNSPNIAANRMQPPVPAPAPGSDDDDNAPF